MEGIRNIKVSAKNNKSFFYYFSFFLIIAMYIFFFNSKSFLPDASPVINTDINKVMYLGGTRISISRWEYNPQKNFMEVELNYDDVDSTNGITTKLYFTAKPKSDITRKLVVKTLITTGNIYIIHIENIPKNFEAIALKVSQNSGINNEEYTEDFSIDNIDKNMQNDSTDNNQIVNNSTTLYCDYRKVKINNNLKTETQKNYIIDITKRQINTMKDNINIIDKKVEDNKKLIDMCNKKISDLKEQFKYEIEQEQKSTTQQINSYNFKINDIVRKNNDLINNKNLIQEKIKKLQAKIQDISK